jgi:hypothetical protein
MPGRKSNTEYKPSPYAADIAKILEASPGPFTRKMIAEKLGKDYPYMYRQDLMNIVSGAMLMDKLSKAGRFQVVKKGWYGLAGKEY